MREHVSSDDFLLNCFHLDVRFYLGGQEWVGKGEKNDCPIDLTVISKAHKKGRGKSPAFFMRNATARLRLLQAGQHGGGDFLD